MANPTMVEGATTKTFRPGNIQATKVFDRPRQRKLVSSDATVRVLEISTTDDRWIVIDVVGLPLADDGTFSGYTSLRAFLLTTVNWAEKTFTFTDTDTDAFTVRYWDDEFLLKEVKKDQIFEGKLLFRVEV